MTIGVNAGAPMLIWMKERHGRRARAWCRGDTAVASRGSAVLRHWRPAAAVTCPHGRLDALGGGRDGRSFL